MSRTLVVVTHSKDKWRLELLCRSIHHYLYKCRIHIVYNENTGFDKWKLWFEKRCGKMLSEYPIEFSQKLDYWSLETESHLTELERCGWVDQQLLKLAVAKHIKTDEYLILDSKNFFIKKCRIDTIKQVQPASIDWCEDILKNWIRLCCERIGVPYRGNKMHLTQNTTPYILDTKLVKELVEYFNGIENLYVWFTSHGKLPDFSPAEFFLYEIFSIKRGQHRKGTVKGNIIGFWSFQIEDLGWKLNDFYKLINDVNVWEPGVCLSSFHGSLDNHLTDDDIRSLVVALGADTGIIPTKTKSPFG